MGKKLLDLTITEFLNDLGAGKHKPGSGSAAAFNGLIACQLLRTVAKITLKKKSYSDIHVKCTEIEYDIEQKIFPELTVLFQTDSDQFHKAIVKRKQRNAEQNQKVKNDLAQEALDELIISTELPIKIADLSKKLAEHSIFLLKHGYIAVRGDSGVALSSSLAAITGCIAIIELNLTSFPKNNWTKDVFYKVDDLNLAHFELLNQQKECLENLNNEAQKKNQYLFQLDELKSELKSGIITENRIEKFTIKLQRFLWLNREVIYKEIEDIQPLDVLKPEKVIELLGYKFEEKETLGVHPTNYGTNEIAGIMRSDTMEVILSNMFPAEIKKFTAAHELGHVLMHDDLELHRDIPLDGSIIKGRNKTEFQADKFASLFLMPRKMVIKEFEKTFNLKFIEMTEDVVFGLAAMSSIEFRKKVKNLRNFSRFVAKTNMFNHSHIDPLNERFGVSIEAMAIRLEELGLVEFDKISG